LGYDIYENDKAKEFLTYTNLDSLLETSDLVSIHIPYIKGVNDNFINNEMIKKMKDGAVLINVACKNLVDLQAVCESIKNNKL
jgi:D-lactate dehydrogenase